MPDKKNSRCGKGCIRCWKNKLKHGNKLKKKNFPKQNIWDIPIFFNESRISYNESCLSLMLCKNFIIWSVNSNLLELLSST